MGKNYDQRLAETKFNQKMKEGERNQIERAISDPKNAIAFSTWFIDALEREGYTRGLLVIFPWRVPKKCDRMEKFKERVQDAFKASFVS